MKTIKGILKGHGSSAAPTHTYNRHVKKIYDAETHKRLQKVREDMAAGRPIYVPKQK